MINRLRQLFQSVLPIQIQTVSTLKAVGCFILTIAVLTIGFLHSPVALADNYDKDYLVEEDFSGRDLTDSSFTLANMRKANLSHADLRGVSLFSAHLEEANLEGANLSGATLDKAHLVKANLKNAILENAFAFNARFNGAVIDGADFTGVLLRQDMQDLLCDVADGVNPTTGRATRDTLDCFY